MGSGCRGTGAAGPALASAEHRNAAAEGVWIFPQGLGGCNIMSCASRRPEPAQTRQEAASCPRQVTDPRGTCELWLGAVCGQGTGNTRLPPNTGQVSRSSARTILSPGPPLFSPSTALLVWAVLQRSASSSSHASSPLSLPDTGAPSTDTARCLHSRGSAGRDVSHRRLERTVTTHRRALGTVGHGPAPACVRAGSKNPPAWPMASAKEPHGSRAAAFFQ